MLFCKYEDMKENLEAEITKIANFLEVEVFFVSMHKFLSTHSHKKILWDKLYQKVFSAGMKGS